MFDVTSIGDSTIDTFLVIDDASLSCDLKKEHCKICFDFADKIPITYTTQSIGGNACNAAVSFAKLGLKTNIFTELGDDLNGLVIKNELERKKVNTDNIKMIKNGETRYSMILNYKGERTIFSYHVKRNYTLNKIPDTKWIYYTSLSKGFEKLQNKLINFLEKNPQTKLAFNPGSYQMKKGLKEIKKIFPFVSILFLNLDEAKELSNKNDIKSMFNYFHRKGVEKVVITDADKGSYISDGQAMYKMPSYKVKVKAKTGAGDAFASAFLSAIIKNKTIKDALVYGTANAGSVISEFGAQKGLQTENGLEKMIRQHKKTIPKQI